MAMVFVVWDAANTVRYISRNWPMARAALDTVVAEDRGCPRLGIFDADDFDLLHPYLAELWHI